ncbi:MAG: ABC transporter ATP-binding protein [Clostridia bacterium]|nr:ABC transporter ATP-binding protein [Clostridia bacterium]
MIEVCNLTRRFGNNYAVDDVSFTIKEGEIVGLLGPNGAGKSTTMNMITGYLSPTSGKVLVDGVDVFEEPQATKKQIGFLPEQPPLYMDMTVWEYLSFVHDLKNCEFNKKEHLAEIMGLVKITEVKDKLIKNLSKGFKQRVGIAGTLIGNPKIIILDEPTVGLSPEQVIEFRSLVRSLGKKHTVILSTHILGEVQAICGRILVMNQGKIIADQPTASFKQTIGQNNRFQVKIAGPQKEVQNLLRSIHSVRSVSCDGQRDVDAYTYIIEYSGSVEIRKMLFNELAKKGWPILAMEDVSVTLEDVFVQLIKKAEESPEFKANKKQGGDNK